MQINGSIVFLNDGEIKKTAIDIVPNYPASSASFDGRLIYNLSTKHYAFFDGTLWQELGISAAAAPQTLIQLTDTPTTYSGYAGYVLAVNPSSTGIAFIKPSIAALSDVDTSGQLPGDILVYNGLLSKYTSIQPGAAAGVQKYNANLDQLANIQPSSNQFIVSQANAWKTTTGASARSVLGLGTIATASTNDYLSSVGGTITGNVQINSGTLFISQTPTSAFMVANKSYVDSAASGLEFKDSVKAVTTSALPTFTLGGPTNNQLTATAVGTLLIDGTAVAVGDRVLIKNEIGSNAPFNGIFVIVDTGSTSTAWIVDRALDANSNINLRSGMFTLATSGVVNAQSGWVLTTPNPIVVNTSPLSFVQFSSVSALSSGIATTVAGNNINVNYDNSTISINGSNQVYIPTGAITNANLSTNGIITLNSGSNIGSLTLGSTLTITPSSGIGVVVGTNSIGISANIASNSQIGVSKFTSSFLVDASGLVSLKLPIAALDSIANDMTITAAVINDMLVWNNTSWINKSLQFTYSGASSLSHIITHNLKQQYCNVSIIDSANNEQIMPTSITFDTINQATITFTSPVAIVATVIGISG